MTDTSWTVIEARHAARLEASRAQVLEAELDLDFIAERLSLDISDVKRAADGSPREWTQIARAGVVKQAFTTTVESTDPVVLHSQNTEFHRQTVTTTVEPEPGEDGRIGVVWELRAEVSAADRLARWIQRRSRTGTQRSLQKRFTASMSRWAQAIESRPSDA